MRRYGHTIALVLIVAAIVALWLWRMDQRDACEADGGVYVDAWDGWTCVR